MDSPDVKFSPDVKSNPYVKSNPDAGVSGAMYDSVMQTEFRFKLRLATCDLLGCDLYYGY